MPTYRGPDFLTSYEQADIKTDLSNAVADSEIGSGTITYRHLVIAAGGSVGYTPSTGVISDSDFTEVTGVPAVIGIPTDADVKNYGIDLETTHRKFLIDRSDLSYDPASGDQLVYDSTTFDIVKSAYSKATNVVVVFTAILGGEG